MLLGELKGHFPHNDDFDIEIRDAKNEWRSEIIQCEIYSERRRIILRVRPQPLGRETITIFKQNPNHTFWCALLSYGEPEGKLVTIQTPHQTLSSAIEWLKSRHPQATFYIQDRLDRSRKTLSEYQRLYKDE